MYTFSNENALVWTPTSHSSEDARIARREQNRAPQDWEIGRKILDRGSKSMTWGALHYTGPTGQSKHFHLNHPPFWLLCVVTRELERDWKRKFLKMERQFSVGLDRPVKEDHFDLKISTWAEPFHLRLDRNFRCITPFQENNPCNRKGPRNR